MTRQQILEQSEQTCPCGAQLERAAEHAHGICDRCRVDAHKQTRKRRRPPDFVDVPLPGLEDWGQP
jgi:hypothetical protein